jgi:peptide deformylase
VAARRILRWPDRRLSTPAAPVEGITDEIRGIWDDMIDTMEAMPGQGVGLAAPQIGVMLRLAVVDASDTRGQAVRMANPDVIDAAPHMRAHDEASPCLPGVSATLERPAMVRVSFIDQFGVRVAETFEGLWATSVQHQIDHLDGRMYFHHLSRLKRERLLARARKLAGGA